MAEGVANLADDGVVDGQVVDELEGAVRVLAQAEHFKIAVMVGGGVVAGGVG